MESRPALPVKSAISAEVRVWISAGFIGKFYIVTAGVGSLLWIQVIVLAVSSAIGLFYYLRVITAMYSVPGEAVRQLPGSLPAAAGVALAAIVLFLIFLGFYPSPLIDLTSLLIFSGIFREFCRITHTGYNRALSYA